MISHTEYENEPKINEIGFGKEQSKGYKQSMNKKMPSNGDLIRRNKWIRNTQKQQQQH